MKIRRGDVVLVHLGESHGVEIRNTRPAIVVSNDIANEFSSLVTVVPLTSQKLERVYPFEVLLKGIVGLPKASKAMADQIRSIDKSRVSRRLTRLPARYMRQMDRGLKIHLALMR